jgi:hypothetical protein
MSESSQSPTKTATAVVDHGNITAVRTTSRSAWRNRVAGSYQEAKTAERLEALDVLLVAAVMFECFAADELFRITLIVS